MSLLAYNGHIAVDVNNVETIVKLINNYPNYKQNIKPLAIDIINQTKEILD